MLDIVVSLFVKGSNYGDKTCVTGRTGASPSMIDETWRHFKHAVACLEKGFTKVSEKSPQTRSDFGDDWQHAESRVTVWGSVDVLCKNDTGDVQKLNVSINQVNEYTTAQVILDAVWGLIGVFGYAPLTAEELERHNAQPPAQRAPENAPKSNEKGSNSSATSNQALSTTPDESGVVYLGAWDDRKPEYKALIGKRVSTDVARINAILANGVAKWELYPRLSNGRTGQYPVSTVYSDGQYNAPGIVDTLTALAQPGGVPVDGKWLVEGKLATRKNKSGEDRIAFYTELVHHA